MLKLPATALVPLTVREAIAVVAGLLGLIAVQLAATDSFYVLQEYFWTDELCTWELITDRDLGHALRALRGAVDINPPGLHLLLLPYSKLVGSTSEIALRSFAALCMVVALSGIYVCLREAYNRLVAIVATLAIWSHPLILDHAFEVRYYGPWLAAAAWFCFLLGRARSRELGRLGILALGVASFVLCTVHYFGIVTLLIVFTAQWIWHREPARFTRGPLAAVAVGPLATAAALVYLLPVQRAATTISTWIPGTSVARIADFGITVFLPMHLGAIVLVAWLARLTMRDAESNEGAFSVRPVPSALIGLTSLALFVPALIVFSLLIQPSIVGRYGLTAIGALAPAVAFGVSRIPRVWMGGLIAFLIASSAFQLAQRSDRARENDRLRQELIRDIRERAGTDRVFFEAPHQLNVVWHYAPDLRSRVFLLDFKDGDFGDNVAPFRVWSRDLARQLVKYYDAPTLVSWDEVRRAEAAYVVLHEETYKRKPSPNERYPQFIVKPVHGQLHQLVRVDGP